MPPGDSSVKALLRFVDPKKLRAVVISGRGSAGFDMESGYFW
jgi:hypothetical protein